MDDQTLRIGVSIEYLTERMRPPPENIFLNLSGCSDASYVRFRDDADEADEACELEQLVGSAILSAEDSDPPLTIWLDDGKLTLGYDALVLTTPDGREMPIEELRRVAREYWDAFGN